MKKEVANLLNAENLKSELWDMLLKVKSKEVSPEMANSVASQSREIMRVIKIQLLIAQMPNKNKSKMLSTF